LGPARATDGVPPEEEIDVTKFVVLFKEATDPAIEDAMSTTMSTGFDPLVGVFEAASREKACDIAAEACGLSGEYAAVPARSWDPQSIVVEPSVKITRGKVA